MNLSLFKIGCQVIGCHRTQKKRKINLKKKQFKVNATEPEAGAE